MTSKKLLSAVLALMLMMSFMTALPVFADVTVAATANGTAVNSGDTISATASLELTLSQAVTDAATQVVFQEYNKKYVAGTASTGDEWYPRRNIATMNDVGTVLSVTFPAGFLNYGSKYRFAFDLDAEAEGYEAEFIFVADTDATYYFIDDFSRFPAGKMQPLVANQYNAATNSHASGSFPWAYMGHNAYCPVFVLDNNETGHENYLKIYGSTPNGCGVDLNGAYLNKAGAGTTIKGQVDATVKITAKDLSDMYSVGIIGLYYNNDTSWDVYVRTKNTLGNNSTSAQNAATVLADFEKVATVNFDSAEEASGWHTVSYCDDQTVSNSNLVTKHSVWHIEIDGEVVVSTTTGWSGKTITTSSTATQTGDFVNVGSTFGSRIFDTIDVDTTDTSYSEMYVDKISFKSFVAEPLTASVNSTYAENGKITYTFAKPINTNTITADSLVLEQEYSDAWYPMDSVEFVTFASNTVVELNFADGDLTPGMNYRIRPTSAISALDGGALSAMDPFTFTAVDKDDCLVYENFERFPAANIHSGASDLKCHYTKGIQPFYLQAGYIGNSSSVPNNWDYDSRIGETDGDKFMCIDGTNSKMISYRFNNKATGSLPEGEKSNWGIAEFTFSYDAVAAANNLLIFGGVALQRDAEDNTKWNIYYQTSAFGYNSNHYQLSGDTNIAAFTKLGTWTTSAALDAKHVLKIETYNTLQELASSSVVDYQILKSITLDGNKVLTDEIGNGIVLVPNSSSAAGLNGIHWSNNVGDTTIVAVAKPDAATAVSGKVNLNLYEYKYYSAVDVAESAQAAESIIFSVTNRTNSTVSAIPVLAVYDGTDFVRVDGLNATATSIAAGATETFTKTITSDDSGYNYKFMLLNSKDSLQPLWYATKGTIN